MLIAPPPDAGELVVQGAEVGARRREGGGVDVEGLEGLEAAATSGEVGTSSSSSSSGG